MFQNEIQHEQRSNKVNPYLLGIRWLSLTDFTWICSKPFNSSLSLDRLSISTKASAQFDLWLSNIHDIKSKMSSSRKKKEKTRNKKGVDSNLSPEDQLSARLTTTKKNDNQINDVKDVLNNNSKKIGPLTANTDNSNHAGILQPIAFYIHGSEDSLDEDKVFIFEQMPSQKESLEFVEQTKDSKEGKLFPLYPQLWRHPHFSRSYLSMFFDSFTLIHLNDNCIFSF